MTETVSDLPPQILKEFDITVVPIVIIFGVEEFEEDFNLSRDEYYEKFYSSKEYPKTAAPTIQRDLEAFQKLGNEADEIIDIVLSTSLSGTYGIATRAKEIYKKRVKNAADVYIYNSHHATISMGLVALRAAQLAKKGYTAKEIIRDLDVYRDQINFSAYLYDLQHLHRGGRLKGSKYYLAKATKFLPILSFVNGELTPLKKVRKQDKARTETIKQAWQRINQTREFNAYIFYGREMKEDVERMKEEIKIITNPTRCNITSVEMGMTVITHTGPAIIGVVMDPVGDFVNLYEE